MRRMGTIVFCPAFDRFGSVSRFLAITDPLVKRGYSVCFAGSGKFAPFLEKEACERVWVHSLSEPPFPHTLNSLRSAVKEECALLDSLKPAAIVGEVRPSLKICAELKQIPYLTLFPLSRNPYLWGEASLPLPEGLLRGWKTILPDGIKHSFIQRSLSPAKGRIVDRLREEYGLPPLPGNTRSDRELILGKHHLFPEIKEISRYSGPPENLTFLGPLLLEPSAPPRGFSGEPSIPREESREPVIFIALDSSPDLLASLVRLLEETPYSLVVSLSPHLKKKEVGPFPEGVVVREFAPGLPLMERSSLVICDGSLGTLYQAVLNGLPVLGLPSTPEKEWNLFPFAQTEMAISLSRRKVSKRTLSGAVDLLLGRGKSKKGLPGDHYRKKAREVSGQAKRYRAAWAAASLIESAAEKGV